MDLAEVRVLSTNELVRTYDLSSEDDPEGVARAVYGSLDLQTLCLVRVDRDSALGDITANPAPLSVDDLAALLAPPTPAIPDETVPADDTATNPSPS